ncbi:hypothetical protein F4803DRAFT_223222 [Xylaria telfairii]|nr:hypothetical protein F4803DRAFT_223222 [Xylaria telfairii]
MLASIIVDRQFIPFFASLSLDIMDFSDVSHQMSRKLQHVLPTVASSHPTPPAGIPVNDLSTAENSLLAEDILPLAKCAIADSLALKHLSYPPGFGGDPELLKVMADFINTYFKPSSSVQPNQIITTSGAGNALSGLLSAICDPGDEVLVIGPCWGTHNHFRISLLSILY